VLATRRKARLVRDCQRCDPLSSTSTPLVRVIVARLWLPQQDRAPLYGGCWSASWNGSSDFSRTLPGAYLDGYTTEASSVSTFARCLVSEGMRRLLSTHKVCGILLDMNAGGFCFDPDALGQDLGFSGVGQGSLQREESPVVAVMVDPATEDVDLVYFGLTDDVGWFSQVGSREK
jgi:hypothetical protein